MTDTIKFGFSYLEFNPNSETFILIKTAPEHLNCKFLHDVDTCFPKNKVILVECDGRKNSYPKCSDYEIKMEMHKEIDKYVFANLNNWRHYPE